jgi:hypothetical protein
MRRDDQAPCCSDHLDFIAELTQHVPEPNKQLLCYVRWPEHSPGRSYS